MVFDLLCIDVLLMKYVVIVLSLFIVLVDGDLVVSCVVFMRLVNVYINFISVKIVSFM